MGVDGVDVHESSAVPSMSRLGLLLVVDQNCTAMRLGALGVTVRSRASAPPQFVTTTSTGGENTTERRVDAPPKPLNVSNPREKPLTRCFCSYKRLGFCAHN